MNHKLIDEQDMMELNEHFRLTAARLEGIVRNLGPTLSKEDRELVLDHVAAGEYGVALEALCAFLDEKGARIPRPIYPEIEEVGRSMQLDPGTWEVLGTRLSDS